MAKSPVYTVIVEKSGENVTEMISSLEYEDCLNEDDLVTINVNGAKIEVIDKDYFNIGSRLIFTFGFIEGLMSPKRHLEITETDYNYIGNRVDMTIKGRDLGYSTKKLTSNFIFKNKTASQIASQIADNFGLGKEIDTTTKVYDFIPMGNKNYMQFLKELASKEGVKNDDTKGSIEVYVRGKILYFKYRDFNKQSRRTFTYNQAESLIVDLNVSYEDENNNASESVQSNGIDVNTGKTITSTAKATENKETSVGDNLAFFDVDSNLKGTFSNYKEVTAGKNTYTPANDKSELDTKVGSTHKKNTAKRLKLDLTIELDPTVEAGDIITIAGIAQKHNGNWRIEKVTHSVTSSPATTKIEAYKNATKKSVTTGNNKSTANKNTTQGKSAGTTSKKIYSYDENSIPK